MLDPAIIWDWLGFALRWLHVITAMAWIGSSFYFIALDLGLRLGEGSGALLAVPLLRSAAALYEISTLASVMGS